jgi:hypothetical protein
MLQPLSVETVLADQEENQAVGGDVIRPVRWANTGM